ncbi:hypothetical protein SAMN04488056_101676 [Cohaesibacter marisflavi]|uniref:Uncharacterized protein n=1 Tax=Cohaesibacter marisflavi TaxID=655353 RepID=A0A1I5B0J9_9HYPH|nr:hypothetical protein [Cohaesibacter marisflavi]SFN68248.1 hypothetical protein SAMN04488056_101676 [Cohaesibacter marisflavi]
MTLRLTDVSPKYWGENLPYWLIVLARVGSIALMLSGLFYWVDILGVFGESGLQRGIWLAPVGRVILACSFLIASVGVWQLAFWGVVMWVLSAVTQALAILLVEDFTLYSGLITIAHTLGLIALSICCAWLVYRSSRQQEI